VTSRQLLKVALGLDSSYQVLQVVAAMAIRHGRQLSEPDRLELLEKIAEVERQLGAMRREFDVAPHPRRKRFSSTLARQ